MLNHKINEHRERVTRSQEWSGQIEGYDVFVSEDSLGYVSISVAPTSWNDGGARIGIFRTCPESVAELEAFAGNAERVLRGIATELRAIGKDDLRPRHEQEFERNLAKHRQALKLEADHA